MASSRPLHGDEAGLRRRRVVVVFAIAVVVWSLAGLLAREVFRRARDHHNDLIIQLTE